MGLLIVFMIFISCSKEQIEEPEPLVQEVISFSGGLQEENDVVAGTRTETSLAGKGITSFQVWAFKNKGIAEDNNGDPVEPTNYITPQCVIPGYTVTWANNSAYTTTTNSSGWEYVNGEEQTIKYWDLDAKAYRFIGYVPAAEGAVEVEFYHETNGAYEAYEAGAIDDYSKCRLSYVIDARIEEAPYFSRLWFSNNSPESEHVYPSTVTLQFFQPFARVRFMFTQSDPNVPILIELPHFFPANPAREIHMSGTFSITYPLTGTETKESWETNDITYSMTAFTQKWYKLTEDELDDLDLTKPEDKELKDNQEYWYTVMPTRNQGAYTLTVRVNGEERTCTVPSEYMNWQPGFSYTYIFKVNEDGGVKFEAVNVAFKQWQGNEEKEKIIYNW